jgi:hypothetical protein
MALRPRRATACVMSRARYGRCLVVVFPPGGRFRAAVPATLPTLAVVARPRLSKCRPSVPFPRCGGPSVGSHSPARWCSRPVPRIRPPAPALLWLDHDPGNRSDEQPSVSEGVLHHTIARRQYDHLDRHRTGPYSVAVGAPIPAHPAKTGVAKPRVLVSFATSEFSTPRRPQDRRAALGSSAVVLFTDQEPLGCSADASGSARVR